MSNQPNKNGDRVGTPMEKEARQVLVTTGGDVETAAIQIFQERQAKVSVATLTDK